MKLIENTTDYFEQTPEYVVEYLKKRGINNKIFNDFLKKYKFGIWEGVKIIVEGEPFEVTHILGKSKIAGYDIVTANRNLGTEDGPNVAIALVMGDDIICYNTDEQNVFLWLLQTGDGEKIEIDKTLDDFIKRFEEEKK